MLEAIIIILLFLWLIGLVEGIAGGFIHLLLVIALVFFAFRWAAYRKPFNF